MSTANQVNGKRHREPQTARFWDWINGGYCKLAVPLNCRIRHSIGRIDSEGHSYQETSWTYTKGIVTLSHWTSGEDCDGLYERYCEVFATIDELAEEPREEGEPPTPNWRAGQQEQRDYAAEAAGY